jgi:hypothetical protein
LRLTGEAVQGRTTTTSLPTSYVTGPVHGVASPLPFVGVPMLPWLNMNSVARPGARGVRQD